MIKKKNLWFLTLFSLILVLSIYYITMPSELLLTNSKTKEKEKTQPTVEISENEIISALKVEADTEREKKIKELNATLSNEKSSSDEKNRKTVVDLIKTNKRIYPVGRLDYDTTGAIILTNDGELTNLLTHPKNKVEKVYVAKIKGIITKENLSKLCNGVIIDGKKTSKSKAKILKIDKKNNTSIVELIISEGRNHQVKKMFEAINFDVLKLKREAIAFLTLDGLKSGEYRRLSLKEVKKLYGEKNQD